MSALIELLREDAVRLFGKKAPIRALRQYYIVEGEPASGIARRFGVTAPAVRYLLSKYGIRRRKKRDSAILVAVKKSGFEDLDSYFRENWKLTKLDMAHRLGVSSVTVAKYYDAWVAKRRKTWLKSPKSPKSPKS